jgi:hypothetical protein
MISGGMDAACYSEFGGRKTLFWGNFGEYFYSSLRRRRIILDLFNNPVGCLTSLADFAYFLQKYAKSARFLAEVVQ